MKRASRDACGVEGCPNAAARGGLCWTHDRRRRARQPLGGPPAAQVETLERLRLASQARENAEEDEDYELADARLQQAAKAFARRSFAASVQEGMQRAKGRGVHQGRPIAVDPRQAFDLAKAFGVGEAARMLGVSRLTIWRAKRHVSKG